MYRIFRKMVNSVTPGYYYNKAGEIRNNKDDQNLICDKEETSTYFTGTHEVQECHEGQGEIDLHTHKQKCEKNPGHEGFIPVNKLTVEHFPSGHLYEGLYEQIKAVADLTVRIAVTFTSPDRPEFVPGTRDPYPSYDTRGTNKTRTGTGRVTIVTKYTEGMKGFKPFPRHMSENAEKQIKEWWEVVVVTATHVVFDENEAKQSTCRLWFDEDSSKARYIINGVDVVGSDTDRDVCTLYCVTDDNVIGELLEEMVERFDGLCSKYKRRTDEDKLTIIVSHPHGCSKQVSIGQWVHRHFNFGLTSYTYTTATCPGSSGALVYRLGCDWSHHPHSGANAGGLNYSGVKWD